MDGGKEGGRGEEKKKKEKNKFSPPSDLTNICFFTSVNLIFVCLCFCMVARNQCVTNARQSLALPLSYIACFCFVNFNNMLALVRPPTQQTVKEVWSTFWGAGAGSREASELVLQLDKKALGMPVILTWFLVSHSLLYSSHPAVISLLVTVTLSLGEGQEKELPVS